MNPEIENRFTYHAPQGDQPWRYASIRDKAKEFAYMLQALCPKSDELRTALERIEEATMWANASIARHGATQEGPDR